MRLGSRWRDVLCRAWSIRFMALAFLLSAAETILALTDAEFFGVPHGGFAALAGLTGAAAFVARLVAQKDLGV